MKKGRTVYSDMYCQECGLRLTIPRKVNRQRERGHVKTMWCPMCKAERDFDEVRFCDHVLAI